MDYINIILAFNCANQSINSSHFSIEVKPRIRNVTTFFCNVRHAMYHLPTYLYALWSVDILNS